MTFKGKTGLREDFQVGETRTNCQQVKRILWREGTEDEGGEIQSARRRVESHSMNWEGTVGFFFSV